MKKNKFTQTKILKLIKAGESDTLELKSALPISNILNKIVIGMINTHGGIIIIGVSEDGSILGYDASDPRLKERESGEIVLRGLNDRESNLTKYVLIQKVLVRSIHIMIIHVTQSRWGKVADEKGAQYSRLTDKTVAMDYAFNFGRVDSRRYLSIDDESIVDDLSTPSTLRSGDEKIQSNCLSLKPHKNPLLIKFLWEPDTISVMGPHQTETNTFVFPKSKEAEKWSLKFCLNGNYSTSCKKASYIIVEELVTKKFAWLISRVSLWTLVGLSFVPFILDLYSTETQLQIGITGLFMLPLPLITILSMIIWSKRITIFIDRISTIKIVEQKRYLQKITGDKIKINHA